MFRAVAFIVGIADCRDDNPHWFVAHDARASRRATAMNRAHGRGRTVGAFLLGAAEFRSVFTSSMTGERIETYDRGREAAHRATGRRFEP